MLLLGIVTLLFFPIPTFLVHYFVNHISPWKILEFERFTALNIGLGLEFGFVYGIIAMVLLQAPLFEKLPNRIDDIVRSMNLNVGDAIFLSFCAGFGEELLFRSGVQYYLGIVLTSVIFVAIHGYLNPKNWHYSMYGLIVLPFILLLSMGFETFGLWFAISAHFAYDAVLFIAMLQNKDKE
jgi:membrane protease YdiL (CAAX protease family)